MDSREECRPEPFLVQLKGQALLPFAFPVGGRSN